MQKRTDLLAETLRDEILAPVPTGRGNGLDDESIPEVRMHLVRYHGPHANRAPRPRSGRAGGIVRRAGHGRGGGSPMGQAATPEPGDGT